MAVLYDCVEVQSVQPCGGAVGRVERDQGRLHQTTARRARTSAASSSPAASDLFSTAPHRAKARLSASREKEVLTQLERLSGPSLETQSASSGSLRRIARTAAAPHRHSRSMCLRHLHIAGRTAHLDPGTAPGTSGNHSLPGPWQERRGGRECSLEPVKRRALFSGRKPPHRPWRVG